MNKRIFIMIDIDGIFYNPEFNIYDNSKSIHEIINYIRDVKMPEDLSGFLGLIKKHNLDPNVGVKNYLSVMFITTLDEKLYRSEILAWLGNFAHQTDWNYYSTKTILNFVLKEYINFKKCNEDTQVQELVTYNLELSRQKFNINNIDDWFKFEFKIRILPEVYNPPQVNIVFNDFCNKVVGNE